MKVTLPLLSAAVLLASCAVDSPTVETPEKSEAPKPKGATRHYTKRLDADGTVPADAVARMIEQRDMMVAARPLAATNALTNWKWLGPGNVGGRVRAIVIHPTSPNTMWCGSAGGGIWKTTNGGSSWFPLDGFAPYMAVSCMVMDPKNPNKIFAGTGEGGFFDTLQGSSNLAVPMGGGIYVTTTGGTTWSRLSSTSGTDWQAVSRIAIDPNNSSVLLAGTMTGIFRSTNGGTSWTKTSSAKTLDIDFHPSDSKLAVSGSRDGYAMYSTNGGASWSRASGIGSSQRIEIAYARSSPSRVYATVSNSGRISLYASNNGGRNFSRTTSSQISTHSRYTGALWVDPTDPNHLYFGGVFIYKSTNGGASFFRAGTSSQNVGASMYYDQHVIVSHPQYNGSTNQTIFNGDDGGVHTAPNAKSTRPSWRELNNNLGINQFYGAAMAPNGNVVGGLQDQGSLLYTGNTEGWRKVLFGDGSLCAWDPQNPNICYAQIYWIRIYRSTNGGFSFRAIGTRSNIRDRGSNFIPPIVLDPNNANTLLFAGASLWRNASARTGTSWTEIKRALSCPNSGRNDGDDPAHFAKDPPCNISTMAVAKGNSDVIWVGHNHGDIYMTTNGRSSSPTWRKVDSRAMPERWVGRIAIDERDPKRVYVGFMGYHGDNVWRTEDGGTTWVRITGTGSGALPSAPVTSLALHRDIPGVLYAGTDIGVFWTTDDGRSWQTGGKATTTSGVEELVWKDNDTLMIVTHGRGIYTADTVDVAGVRPVGPSCGKSSKPILRAGSPAIGSSQPYALSSATANAPVAFLLAGGRPASTNFGGGCVLQPGTTGLIYVPAGVTNTSGAWSQSLPLPNVRALVGIRLTAQDAILTIGGPFVGIAELSNGLEMRVGL